MMTYPGFPPRGTTARATAACAVALMLLAIPTACSDRSSLTEPSAPTLEPSQTLTAAGSMSTTSSMDAFGEGPKVWTNKVDYVPGEMVLMLGSGFQPGETITLTLSEDVQLHPDRTFSATADTSGAFSFDGFRPEDHHVGVRFLLTATGQVSGLEADWEFLDNIVPGSFQTNHNGDPGVSELTIARPTTVAGTFMIAQITVEGYSTDHVICTPNGWSTQMTPTISSGRTNNSSSVAQQVFWKVATASEPTSYTWQLRETSGSCGTSNRQVTGKGAVGGIIAYTGVDTGHSNGPISHFAGSTGSSNTINAQNISSVPAGSRVLRYFGNDKEFEVFTSGTGTARIYPALRNKSGGGFIKPAGAAADGEQATTGTTATVTGSNSGNGGNWVAQTVVLRKAAAVKSDQTITFPAVGPFTYGDPAFLLGATATSGLAVTYTSLSTGVCTVSGATVTIVSAGTCTIRASQAGNDTYNPAPNVDQNITINKAAQTITFPPVGPFTFGDPAFALGAAASSGLPVSYASLTIGTCTVSGGIVTIVSAGTCTIRASQAGNTNYHAAPDVDRNIAIDKAAQTITFPAVGPFDVGDPAFALGATASSGLPVSYASLTLGVCTVSGSTVTILTGGTCTIRASQAGDTNYHAAPDVDRNIAINQLGQTITFPAVGGFTFGDAPFALGATATSGLTVSYVSQTTSVCTVTGATVTIVSAGTCTIRASQAGNSVYGAAADVDQDITINKASQTITFPALGPFAISDVSFTLGATASSSLAVSYTSLTAAVCTVSGATVTIVSSGTCTIGASQAGNTNFHAAPDVDQNITINKAAQVISFGPLPAVKWGDLPLAVASYAVGGGSGNPVTFTSSTPTICSTTTAGIVSFLDIGACTIKADQAGNASYDAAASVEKSFGISNDPPVIVTITVPADPVSKGYAVNVSASFSDPGYTGDSYTGKIEFTSDAGTVQSTATISYNASTGTGTATTSISTLSAGVFKIKVTVTDRFGAYDTEVYEGYIVVYDPSGGFVTGGGWINSPAGAYTYGPELAGKATFGFVSRYQKGAKVPSGNTEFQFHAAGMNFKGTLMEWLVISGARAQYKGEGTINGTGTYGFLLTAIDGQVNGGGGQDRFRMKIWEKESGYVVYDNEMGLDDTGNPTTVLGGGSIVIHAK